MNVIEEPVAEAKWVASVDDIIIPIPQECVPIALLLDQAGLQDQQGLYRDHNSRNDPWYELNEEVNISDGSVFRTGPAPCNGRKSVQNAPPKLLVVCDDHPEYVIHQNQKGESLRRLFGIQTNMGLFRDFMSPVDIPIGDDDQVDLSNGNVFISRKTEDAEFCINIEGKKYPWGEQTITTAQIRELGNLPMDQPVICENADGSERTLREDETVMLDPCCRFGRAAKYKRG